MCVYFQSVYPSKDTCAHTPFIVTQVVCTLFYTLVFFHLMFLGDGVILVHTRHSYSPERPHNIL